MEQGKNYAILFVDDETQTLKYFKKMLDKIFPVITASNTADAWQIIEQQSDQIGVLITDQRMPEETGTLLLSKVKSHHPHIIRILTTAYSDLEDAITAVNSGAIFYYVTKPWDIKNLKILLKRAMEFFCLQQERDSLVTEKLHVLQKVLLQDRTRSLAVFATSLQGRIHYPVHALKAYFEQAFVNHVTLSTPINQNYDLWSGVTQESSKILKLVNEVLQLLFTQNLQKLITQDTNKFNPLMQQAIEQLNPNTNKSAVSQLLHILLHCIQSIAEQPPQIKILENPIDSIWNTKGISIQLISDVTFDKHTTLKLFSAMYLNEQDPFSPGVSLLAAFLYSFNLGGQLQIHTKETLTIEILLPLSFEESKLPPLADNWLEAFFVEIE